MSLTTWKNEYYPVEASKTKRWSSLRAAEHSLQKWLGLREEVLVEHGLRRIRQWIESESGDDFLTIASDSCSLCAKFHIGHSCEECPLAATLGEPCDSSAASPYLAWSEAGDPEPMISALQKTVRRLKEEAER